VWTNLTAWWTCTPLVDGHGNRQISYFLPSYLKILNGFIILASRGSEFSHRLFRLALKRDLILEAGWVPQLHTTCQGRHIPSVNQLMRLDIRHRHNIYWPLEGRRIRCCVCFTGNKKTRTKFKCPDCSMGLCPNPCFMLYHTKLHFRRLNWH
jgi:hypothetical protein